MFELEFMKNAFMASFFIAILCPFLGLFIVLKRYSMIGDTLSHASLSGVALGLVLGIDPIITTILYTSFCALVIEYLRNYYKRYSEIVMSLVLTFSLGLAIILMTSGKSSIKPDTFLFGSILTITKSDILLIAAISLISFMVLVKIYNDLIYVTFDEEGAHVSGINVKLTNYLFTLLVGATISMSIKIMGVLVISSIIVIPVATAMNLKLSFKNTLIASIIVGFFDIYIGLISSYYLNSAPGGTIALISVFSLLFTIIIKDKKFCRK